MQLTFRPAIPDDYDRLEQLVVEAFEPITWFKKLDAKIGPLNGQTWRDRWHTRLSNAFATQTILVGVEDGEIVAYSSGKLDPDTRLAFIDLLAVETSRQGRGYGRAMLRAMLDHMKSLGALYADLDCLVDNEGGNALYRSEGFVEVARSIRWFKTLD